MARLAENDDLDPAFRALALTLPSEIDVAQAIGREIDPDAVHNARRALQASLGAQIGQRVAEAAKHCPPARPYSPDADSAGRRAFAHAAWTLAVTGGAWGGTEVARVYEGAENLTDRLAALRLLVHFGLQGSEKALASFYQRYRDNPLVLDKWFALQATLPEHAALDRVERLSANPSFSFKNPNRVYALIRSFATGNPVGFNRPDGAGYRYIARIIGEIDRQNPSVAGRLATAFRSFRMLEPVRRGHAEDALREMSGYERLSRDVSDILVRTLEG
jgi:aminopeptidase N